MTRVFYFHGGPGGNSTFERALFEKLLGPNVYCWNEPSLKRGAKLDELNYENWLQSSLNFFKKNKSDKNILIGHSFGVFACHHIALNDDSIDKIILSAPASDRKSSERNIFNFCAEDFLNNNDIEKANKLKDYLSDKELNYDNSLLPAYQIALSNEKLFNRYFYDPNHLQQFFSTQVGEFEYDVDALFNVRKTWEVASSKKNIAQSKCIVVFGENDPIVTKENELKSLRSMFSNLEVKSFEKCSHHPHIEHSEKFLSLIN